MISASAISLFECRRKFAARYWGEKYGWPKPPQGAGAELGSELHDQCAAPYLLHGKQPDHLTRAGAMFISGLPYLPPPGSGGVEGEFTMRVSGIDYLGYVDYRGPLPNFGCIEDPTAGYPVARAIEDHKTSSNMRRYGLWGKEAFLSDPQAVIYAARDMIEARKLGGPGDPDVSHLRWLYFASKGKLKAIPSDVILEWGEVENAFGAIIHPVAVAITKLRETEPDPNSLEPNLDVCSKFGGCPHRGGPCQISENDKIRGIGRGLVTIKPKENTHMTTPNLMDLLKGKNAAAAAANTAPKADLINAPEAAAAIQIRPPSAPVAERVEKAPTNQSLAKIVCAELGSALIAIAKQL